jgi:hypothetical protein
MRLVPSADSPDATQPATADEMAALLLARDGYQAAVDAADNVSLPSLTDFVD